jgi:nucleoside 2-deoxyribosyltransferase
MTDYTLISKFRNKEQCELLIKKLAEKGKTCYDFCAKPADPNNADAHPEDQMKAFESVKDFYNDEYFKEIFEKDLEGLKNAEKVIMLLPAGNSVHMEAGIAFGLGKPLILIGEPEKPESLYLVFNERYKDMDEFLATIS